MILLSNILIGAGVASDPTFEGVIIMATAPKKPAAAKKPAAKPAAKKK
jgi:hypothetical protein